jgi:hypothetical protein
MKFLMRKKEKPGQIELRTYIVGESSGWRKHRTKIERRRLMWLVHVKRMDGH